MNRPLPAHALVDLAAGGTDPAPATVNPTVQAARALRVVADILDVYGDLNEEEYITPFVSGSRVSLGGPAMARAILRAGGTAGEWHRRNDGQHQRAVVLQRDGIEFEAVQVAAVSGLPCSYCDGSVVEPELEPMAGDGAELCTACERAS